MKYISDKSHEEEKETIIFILNKMYQEIRDLRDEVYDLKFSLTKNKTFQEVLSKTSYMLNDCSMTIAHMQRNMKDCQNMIQEFKGIIAIVRPEVRKGGWYGEEVEVEAPTPKSKLKLSKK